MNIQPAKEHDISRGRSWQSRRAKEHGVGSVAVALSAPTHILRHPHVSIGPMADDGGGELQHRRARVTSELEMANQRWPQLRQTDFFASPAAMTSLARKNCPNE